MSAPPPAEAAPTKGLERTVYFGVCGMGLGHAARMVPVAKALQRHGYRSVFSTYNSACQFVRRSGFAVHEGTPLMWAEHPDGSVDVEGTLRTGPKLLRSIRDQVRQERAWVQQELPDAIVSDSRYTTWMAMFGQPMPDFFVTNQVQFLMPQMGNDRLQAAFERAINRANRLVLRRVRAVVVPDLPLPLAISRDNMPSNESARLLRFVGPICPVRPSEVPPPAQVRAQLGIDGPMVFCALSGPGASRGAIAERLGSALRDAPFDVRMTTGSPMSDPEVRSGAVAASGWSDQRYHLLTAADVVISRPGLTTISEVLRYGKPAVLIPTPNQTEQEHNAATMEALGLGLCVPQEEVEERTIVRAVERLLDDKEVHRTVAAFAALAQRYDGAEGLCELIRGYVEGRAPVLPAPPTAELEKLGMERLLSQRLSPAVAQGSGG